MLRSIRMMLFAAVACLAPRPSVAQTPTCGATATARTVQARDTAYTCALKVGAVTVKISVLPAAKAPVVPPPVVTPPAPVDTTTPPVPPPSSGYITPDVLDNASFEQGFDGFTDWTMGGAPTNATRDATTAYDGTVSLKRAWTPNPSGDNTAQIASRVSAAGADRVWLRFYFKLSAPITSIMKFARFYQGTFSTNLGGLFVGSGAEILTFGTDVENSAITTPIGLTQAQVIDGKWHSIEIEYWRNGDPSGYPSAAFWFDGQPLTGTAVKWFGSGNRSYWSGGRLYTGSRTSSEKINVLEWAGTLNAGNITTGQVNIDRVSISTKGRIGP